ncbi:isoprenoid synthase domain-containing protein [Podospora fimiseda]|uniref:Isoprenoid synthase domain-containing protein n=1 Tax=Podospora fimiseda TaxID=252190 RepID=A0AAN6YNT7_9PEZI|nr:isoprenoid synthase domain-containing protein [Podospora fimiseda]
MEYLYSDPVDTTNYDDEGFASGIPVRVHKQAHLADRGAMRAQEDWKKEVGPLPIGFVGTMCPNGPNSTALMGAEMLPDRLEITAYGIELSFLIDDMVDQGESSESLSGIMKDLTDKINVTESGEWTLAHEKITPITRLLMKWITEMMQMDATRTLSTLKWFKNLYDPVAKALGRANLPDLDTYLQRRIVSVGSSLGFGILLFAMDLEIPDDQQQSCFALSKSGYICAALSNDYYSWDREFKMAARGEEGTQLHNAIEVLMRTKGLTIEEAKKLCIETAKHYGREYKKVFESLKDRDDLCADAYKMSCAMQLILSGSVFWSQRTPRYHPDRELPPVKGLKTAITSNGYVATNGVHNVKSGRPEAKIVRDVAPLGNEHLIAPSLYLDQAPSKGVRERLIKVLNIWYDVTEEDAALIKSAVALLYGASLMIDDIQDSSPLRHSCPSVHAIFGEAQTVNSTGFRYVQALLEVRKLNSERCMEIFCDELTNLYIGQSHDIFWIQGLECPSEDQYLSMVDGKTSGLFRMIARFLDAKSTFLVKPDLVSMVRFVSLLGRLFQIRDDYMNLTSLDYTKQKGFCEDLDKGKYSLPLIHALRKSAGDDIVTSNLLCNLLAQQRRDGKLTTKQKQIIVEQLEKLGSLAYTRDALDVLQGELREMAREMGIVENQEIKSMLAALEV